MAMDKRIKNEIANTPGRLYVPRSAKTFAERLNQCLDENDAPENVRERAVVLAKMTDISKQQAWALLEGLQIPDQNLLERIANEFEVDQEWLSGDK